MTRTVNGRTYRVHKPKKTVQDKLLARVRAGAAYLNVINPNWFKKIDLDDLDLTSSGQCVIGQLYKGYGNRGEIIDGETQVKGNGIVPRTTLMGFHLEDSRNVANTDANWAILNSLWKKEIKKLKKSA